MKENFALLKGRDKKKLKSTVTFLAFHRGDPGANTKHQDMITVETVPVTIKKNVDRSDLTDLCLCLEKVRISAFKQYTDFYRFRKPALAGIIPMTVQASQSCWY